MNEREKDAEERKHKIIEASLELFVRRGFGSTRIKDIAMKAGMSMGLFFHYFKNKDEVYELLIDRGVSSPNAMIAEGMDVSDPLAFFEGCAKALFGYLEKSRSFGYMFVLVNNTLIDDTVPQKIREKLHKLSVSQASVPLIVKGQEQGTIRDGDPYALAFTFWNALTGVIEQIIRGNISTNMIEAQWFTGILSRAPKEQEKTKSDESTTIQNKEKV